MLPESFRRRLQQQVDDTRRDLDKNPNSYPLRLRLRAMEIEFETAEHSLDLMGIVVRASQVGQRTQTAKALIDIEGAKCTATILQTATSLISNNKAAAELALIMLTQINRLVKQQCDLLCKDDGLPDTVEMAVFDKDGNAKEFDPLGDFLKKGKK